MIEPIFRLQKGDGTWGAFEDDWRVQCENHEEDFSEYALGTFGVLEELISEPQPKSAAFAIHNGSMHSAICQINTTMLPGYQEPVMRVRHMAFCPELDFGDGSIEDYSDALVGAFTGILALSEVDDQLKAKHLKMHLKSPADRQFFSALSPMLGKLERFTSVRLVGSWLYVDKS
ncbi:hypothetical protein IWQ49_006411 [Labrenzia sp. EL_126]|nr:hypothetical protein [Labrenzia sp. EL_126]